VGVYALDGSDECRMMDGRRHMASMKGQHHIMALVAQFHDNGQMMGGCRGLREGRSHKPPHLPGLLMRQWHMGFISKATYKPSAKRNSSYSTYSILFLT